MTYRPLNLSRLSIHQCLLSGSRSGDRKIDSHSIFISSGESAPTGIAALIPVGISTTNHFDILR
jgi:hypothetical protein